MTLAGKPLYPERTSVVLCYRVLNVLFGSRSVLLYYITQAVQTLIKYFETKTEYDMLRYPPWRISIYLIYWPIFVRHRFSSFFFFFLYQKSEDFLGDSVTYKSAIRFSKCC